MAEARYRNIGIFKRLKNALNQHCVQLTRTKSGFFYEFQIHKIILWPCGLWPLEEKSVSNTIRYLLAISSQVRHHDHAIDVINLEHL